MVESDSIPLTGGEIEENPITPISGGETGAKTSLRCRRRNSRKSCGRSLLCFSHTTMDGRVDQAACPILNISVSGVAFEYDEQLQPGLTGFVAYRSASGKPVQINCVVRECRPISRGRYTIGVQLDRKLQFDEIKPAYASAGREIAAGLRPRKLRETPND